MWHNDRAENLFHIYIYIYCEISYSGSGLKPACLSLLLEEMEWIFLTKLNGKCFHTPKYLSQICCSIFYLFLECSDLFAEVLSQLYCLHTGI